MSDRIHNQQLRCGVSLMTTSRDKYGKSTKLVLVPRGRAQDILYTPGYIHVYVVCMHDHLSANRGISHPEIDCDSKPMLDPRLIAVIFTTVFE